MNKTVLIILLFAASISTSSYGQKNREMNRHMPDTISLDSLQYELIIIDPGFDSWLATQPPRDFFSNQYYASMNRLYVSEWNQRYLTGRQSGMYETYVDYNPNIDYDIDLNYRLYYYFRYFEETNNVRLIPGRR